MASGAAPIAADSVAPPASRPASSFRTMTAPSTSATTTTISTINGARRNRQPRPIFAKNRRPPVKPGVKMNSANTMFLRSANYTRRFDREIDATLSMPQTPRVEWPNFTKPMR